jgi:hypothetical protein
MSGLLIDWRDFSGHKIKRHRPARAPGLPILPMVRSFG